MTLTDRQYALLQRLSRMPDTALSALSQEMDLAPQTLRQDVNALMPLFLLCIAVGTSARRPTKFTKEAPLPWHSSFG